MSLLAKNSEPAERACGLVFVEKFESPTSVAKNEGTITGAIPMSKDGAVFDGTNDYIVYPIGVIPSSASLTLRMIIKAVNADFDNTVLEIFNSEGTVPTTNKGFVIALDDRGIANTATKGLFFRLQVATGSREVYVNNCITDNEVADFVFVWNGTAVTATKNGVALTVNTVVAASGTGNFITSATRSPTIGAVPASFTNKFKGTLKLIQWFNTALTTQVALDYANNATFNYRQKMLVDLQMGMEDYDFTNKRVLDRSGKGNHFTLGDGSTANTFPTKTSANGFLFDGSAQYLRSPNTTLGNFVTATKFAVSAWYKRTSTASNGYIVADKLGGTGWGLYQAASGQYSIYSDSTNSPLSPLLPNTEWHNITFSYEGNGTGKFYVDGKLVDTLTNYTYTAGNNYITIGSRTSGVYFAGTITKVKIWSGMFLTEIQAKDVFLNDGKSLNKI